MFCMLLMTSGIMATNQRPHTSLAILYRSNLNNGRTYLDPKCAWKKFEKRAISLNTRTMPNCNKKHYHGGITDPLGELHVWYGPMRHKATQFGSQRQWYMMDSIASVEEGTKKNSSALVLVIVPESILVLLQVPWGSSHNDTFWTRAFWLSLFLKKILWFLCFSMLRL